MDLGKCAICGEGLGVHEELVIIDRDGARTTSHAAEPDLHQYEAARYHRACYEALDGPRSI